MANRKGEDITTFTKYDRKLTFLLYRNQELIEFLEFYKEFIMCIHNQEAYEFLSGKLLFYENNICGIKNQYISPIITGNIDTTVEKILHDASMKIEKMISKCTHFHKKLRKFCCNMNSTASYESCKESSDESDHSEGDCDRKSQIPMEIVTDCDKKSHIPMESVTDCDRKSQIPKEIVTDCDSALENTNIASEKDSSVLEVDNSKSNCNIESRINSDMLENSDSKLDNSNIESGSNSSLLEAGNSKSDNTNNDSGINISMSESFQSESDNSFIAMETNSSMLESSQDRSTNNTNLLKE